MTRGRPDTRRRDRPRLDLRAHGCRDRARLRRPSARQLRVRPADHGRRLRTRAYQRQPGAPQHRALLRCRSGALTRPRVRRVSPAPARFADDDARRDVRDQLPAPEHRTREVRSDREDRRRHPEAQRARDDRGCARQVDHDRHDPGRARSLRGADASPHEDDDRASDAGSVDRLLRPPASWEFERTP